jgi:hypothetical protein
VGNAYINDANKANLSVKVAVGSTSTAADTIRVTITDGATTTTERTATAPNSAGEVTVTNINATGLTDGSVTVQATASNATGTSSATTASATKDTVKPAAAAGSVSNITSGSTFSVPYTASDNAPSSTLDKVELYVDAPGGPTSFSLSSTDTTPAASGRSLSHTGATTDGTYGFAARAYDKAGNAEDGPTAAEQTATRDTAPDINRAIIAKTDERPDSTAGSLRQNGKYFVYADVSPRNGNTVAAVSANLNSVTAGTTNHALTACSPTCTVNGESYNYVSSGQATADNPLSAGPKTFSITARDNLNQTRTTNFNVTVDNTRPTVSAVATNGEHDGVLEQGDTITFTYSEPIDGISLLAGWVWPFSTANVEVTFTDKGTGNSDLMSVKGGTAFGTAVDLGTIELGASTYVTGGNNRTVFFGGATATTNSTIVRSTNPNANSMVVTLGSQVAGTGTLGSAASSIIKWAPGNTNAYDAAGNKVTTPPADVQSSSVAQF